MQLGERLPGQNIAIGIRTHRFGLQESSLYEKLLEYFKADDIFFIIDSTKNSVSVPSYCNGILIKNSSLDDLGLFSDVPRVGWRCGDYFYYFFATQVDREFYWLIEPDVAFTHANASLFFKNYEMVSAKFMASSIKKMNSGWRWYESGRLISDDVFGCMFPLTRIDKSTIEFLLRERQKLSLNFRAGLIDRRLWPNDESFVCTTLVKNKSHVASLMDGHEMDFDLFSVKYPVYWRDGGGGLPLNKVVHPALSGDDFDLSFRSKLKSKMGLSDLKAFLKRVKFCQPEEIQRHIDKIASEEIRSLIFGN